MSIREFIEPIVEKLKESSGVKTVYGEPMTVENKTIIPVARAGYGFGGRPGKSESGEGEGDLMNAIGGTMSSPIGVLEVNQEETRFIPVNDHHPLKLLGAFAAGMMLGAFLVTRARRRGELDDV